MSALDSDNLRWKPQYRTEAAGSQWKCWSEKEQLELSYHIRDLSTTSFVNDSSVKIKVLAHTKKIWKRSWRFVGEISVAKSGGTKKNSSDVAFQRKPRVLAVLSVSISRKSVVRRRWLWTWSAGCCSGEWMAVHQPWSEYLSVRSRKTLDLLVAVREDPVETVAESDKTGGFQLIAEKHRQSCLFAS